MQLSLAQVQSATGAITDRPLDGLYAAGWSIDSRTTQPGDVFFAIEGERLNGHLFVHRAAEQGAVAAVISEVMTNEQSVLLRVADTQQALQQLAQWARRYWGRPIVAITGSAGKTTTKDLVAALLELRFKVGKTIGNYNNHLGVPLSLLQMPEQAEIGVIEIGMNHAGEIRHLASIAKPEIGVVTNVGYAHVEAFDSIEGIALAKRELIEALPESGTAVLNADDERVLAFREIHPGRVVTYGFSEHSDVRATDVNLESGRSWFSVGKTRFSSVLTGRHGVLNNLAALAVAGLFGIAPSDLAAKIADFRPGKMRGERTHWRGITILNDSYNSNPEAARSMIDVLREEPATRRIAVLGEMLELGRLAEKLHRELGLYVATAGIDVLIGIRGGSRFMVDAAKEAGTMHHAAFFFDEPEEAGVFLKSLVQTGDAVLFKGSRGTRVEKALETMEA